MPHEPPRVSVLVLNYNGLTWLQRCLSSVTHTDYPNLGIYLVDNGSRDRSVEYVRRSHPAIKIIMNEENMGFAKAYNRAIAAVNTPYVVLLNNDTEVLDRGWVRHLVDKASGHPRIAAVACKMVSYADRSLLDSVGGMGIPFWRGFVDIGRAESDKGQYDHEAFEPFAFCGGAALIKRDIFLEVGCFDSRYFMYMEDADLSWRLRLLGYRIAYAPNATVAHYFSGSTGSREIDERKLYHSHRNVLRTILKNCGSSLSWALRNYLLFSLITAVGLAILEPKKAVALARAIAWNITNFKDTHARRLRIQRNRRVSEKKLLLSMYPNHKRYQPQDRFNLRRILDVLFERSQRHYLNKPAFAPHNM